jgi:hypothetical protein
MGKLIITISDSLDRDFKKAIIDRYGSLRTHMTKCGEEAIQLWLQSQGQ